VSPLRIITATAPIRICDNGGWTDTWYARQGKVFNIAVRPRVMVQIAVFPHGALDGGVVINAENYGVRYAPTLDAADWGPHPLIEASLRAIASPDDVDIEITIRSKVPAGASTGTSAAVVVALLGALDRLTGGRRTAHQIATDAHAVETVWLGGQSGVQDQLCSAFGGVNFIEIVAYPSALVSRLDLPDQTRFELQRRLSLVYLGQPHSSSAVHEQVLRDLARRGPDCAELDTLRGAAQDARDAVIRGDLEALGQAMRRNTDAQAQLHRDIVSANARRIIEIAAAHGAAGWKVNGAGGDGGSITLLSGARIDTKRAMIRAIQQENSAWVRIPIVISRQGLQVWEQAVSPSAGQ
jgi:D-glycero-alpha-D-manno-heptose-7-phosphate kinase